MIELGFDPMLHLGPFAVRWQTIGVTLVLLLLIGLLARHVAGRSRPAAATGRAAGAAAAPRSRFPDAPRLDDFAAPRAGRAMRPAARTHDDLRLDDLLLIVAAIVPGAVLGGRLVHGLDYLAAYAAAPMSLFDPALGSLSLFGALLGGTVSALYVARLIGAPIRRWADVAAVPLLIAMGLGKLSQLLGGSGQGLPFDGPWALAFTGAGPWVSANPALPAHPAQFYEALWLLVGAAVVVRAAPLLRGVAAGGHLFVALAWFMIGRVAIGFTWRDSDAVGPLNMEQALALLALALLLIAARPILARTTQPSTG